ncbi:MAG: hypothetical protein IBJ09_13450 [Bacteroidia bacterium]|nr:hypothetical protein [Bacteroidia bacterium]
MFRIRSPHFFVLLCLFTLPLPALRAQSLVPYTQYQKSGYELSRALTACSPGGNFAKAEWLLNEPYWQQEPKDRNLLRTLLLWNVYGRERAMAFDDSLRQSGTACHNELYTKTWLAFYSKSNDDYTLYMQQLLQQQPEDPLTTRLRTEALLRDKGSAWGKSSPLTSSQAFIDSILNSNLSEDDRVFYLLARCRTGYGRSAEHRADSIICALWSLYPDRMHRGSVKYHTEKCGSVECKQIFEQISLEDKAAAPQTPGYKVRELLREFMVRNKIQNGSVIKADTALENSLRRILLKESNPIEKEKLRGLIKYGSNGAYQISMEYSPYRSSSKEIVYSPGFSALLKSTLPKKELFNLMMQELNTFVELSKEARDKDMSLDTLGNRMQREYARLTEEDLSVMTGIMISSRYVLDELKESPLYAQSGVWQEQIYARDMKTWSAYFGFLGKNPLYSSGYIYFPYSSKLRPESVPELLSCIASYDSLVTRYPGALFIKQARLRFISFYCDSFPDLRPRLYGMLLEGMIDITDRDQNTVIGLGRDFGHIELTREDNEYLTYSLDGLLDLFQERIEQKELQRLKQRLYDKAKARPHQENLKLLNFYLN